MAAKRFRDQLKQNGGLGSDSDDNSDVSGSFSGATNSSVYDNQLIHVWRTQVEHPKIFPWQLKCKSPFDVVQKNVFGGMQIAGHLPPMPLVKQAAEISSDLGIQEDVFKQMGLKAVKTSDQRLWGQKISYERKAAYKKWMSLIAVQYNAWLVGRQQMSEGLMKFAQGGLTESVKDCLATRATSTLHARAGPLIRYVQFCRERDIQPFPVAEDVLYAYVKACGDSAPTYPKSLMRAIGFAEHVLGLDLKGDVLESGRIRGCVDSHYSCRRKLVQRPPLTVQQVSELEMIVKDDSRTDSDRLAAGYFLCLIFGRLRYSDGLQISELRLDKVVHQGKTYGFLECMAERSKTSISLERKIRHIPVAIPMTGFTDPSWVEPWLAVRKKLKLVEGANIPLMPSPAEGGGWSKVPVPVGSAASWLRGLIKVPSTGPKRVATHSCKVTLLSSGWDMEREDCWDTTRVAKTAPC